MSPLLKAPPVCLACMLARLACKVLHASPAMQPTLGNLTQRTPSAFVWWDITMMALNNYALLAAISVSPVPTLQLVLLAILVGIGIHQARNAPAQRAIMTIQVPYVKLAIIAVSNVRMEHSAPHAKDFIIGY